MAGTAPSGVTMFQSPWTMLSVMTSWSPMFTGVCREAAVSKTKLPGVPIQSCSTYFHLPATVQTMTVPAWWCIGSAMRPGIFSNVTHSPRIGSTLISLSWMSSL